MSRNVSALVWGLAAGVICAVMARLGVFLPADLAWFGLLARAGIAGPPEALPVWVEPVVMCAGAAGVAWFHLCYPRLVATAVVVAAAAGEVFAGSALAAAAGRAFAPTGAAAALALGAVFAAAAGRGVAAQREAEIRAAFDGAVSPRTLRRILRGRMSFAEPEWFEAGVAACRVVKVWRMAESGTPGRSAAALRTVCGRAAELAREMGGVVIGRGAGGFDVVFGMGGDAAEGTAEFLLAALERLREWNEVCEREFGQGVDVRLGAEMGLALPYREGAAGGRVCFAGDAVLAAERLCAENLVYGSVAAAGPRLQAAAGERMEVRPLDFCAVEGNGELMEIYEVLGRRGALSKQELERRDAYWRGVILARQGRYEDAVRVFDEAAGEGVTDAVLVYHRERAARVCDGSAAPSGVTKAV